MIWILHITNFDITADDRKHIYLGDLIFYQL